MGECFRLGAGGLYEEKHKHIHPRTFVIEATTGPDRLRVGVDGIATLQTLTATMTEPFWLLYVLLVGRGGDPTGRYGTRSPIDRAELESFFGRFGGFLETDGRYELWVKSATNHDLLVYDPHEIVFAYGNLERFRAALTTKGYVAGDVTIPVPHMHYYHAESDEIATELLAARDWAYGPLTEQDEERAEE